MISKRAIIYRCEVLPSTQTFVLSQARMLTRYVPKFAGLGRARFALEIDDEPVLLTQRVSIYSHFLKSCYQLTGISPVFHRSVAKLHPSLVHVHFAEDAPIALPLVRYLKVPMIVTLHGSVEPIPDRHMRRKLRNIVYLARRKSVWKEATLFLCVSKFMRNVAIAAGYPSEKLRVHYIGIDVEKFSPTLEPRDQNLVLFVGRLAEKKGCKYLIQAMAEVQRMRPATELLIVGDGPERDALRAEATRLGVLCEFVGYGSTEDILKLLRTARVFCGPSIAARDSNSEGLGMVFAEAQAVGLPVVSFVHGGIPEVVRHGETGLLAPEKDVQLLTRYLLRYLEDDVFWSKCSRAGIEWIRTQFDLRRQTVELEEIYDAALRAVNDAHPTSIGE